MEAIANGSVVLSAQYSQPDLKNKGVALATG